MVVGIKDTAKQLGVSIIAFCAVFVCTLFLNYYIDLTGIHDKITAGPMTMLYDAQIASTKVVCLITGGCLLITSIIMLLFYIKHYIDTHKKELGILKALGYSNLRIALHFWVFGLNIAIGAALGFVGAYLIMPSFYSTQNADHILPDVSMHWHPQLLIPLVILPTILFALLAVLYACQKLKRPVLILLKDVWTTTVRKFKKRKQNNSDAPFVKQLQKNALRERKILVFFIAFAAFCFSAMTQMSFSMKDLSSVFMGAMILLIGVTLAFTTLFIAITTVINGNTKTFAMMQAFGYSHKECSNALLGGYRPMGYLGFAIGSIYQYVLLKVMVSVVFKDIAGIPEYHFDFVALFISLVVYVLIYEIILFWYSRRIKNISIKEIMLE